jgi:hypothetical protein
MPPPVHWSSRSVYDGRELIATIKRVGNGKQFKVRDAKRRTLGSFRSIKAAMGAVRKIRHEKRQ